jgi:hypothetical protein
MVMKCVLVSDLSEWEKHQTNAYIYELHYKFYLTKLA